MKKSILLALLFVVTTSLFGQGTNNYKISLNHLALSVKDVNASADFYKNVLDLEEITNRTEVEGIRWFSFGEGKELHLVSVIKEPVTLNKAVHFAITSPNFDALVKKLETSKITYSDWPGTLDKITIRADGIKQVYIQDPDGYWIEINSVGQEKK